MNLSKLAFFLGVILSGMTLKPSLAGIPIRPAPPAAYGITYAQVSSAVDQQPGTKVQFELQDSVQAMTITKNSIIIVEQGSYLVIAAPQVTALQDNACIDVWLVVNGKDVPNSGVRECQAKTGNTDVVVTQTILKLKKGDTIQIQTSSKGVKLDAIQPSQGPTIPSIIFTVLGLSTSSK